jgi:3-oxoacyl-[acyl-carrier protein] reductase
MDSGLAGKTVLITGASGGIGTATARAFALEGARLVLHCRDNPDRPASSSRSWIRRGSDRWWSLPT